MTFQQLLNNYFLFLWETFQYDMSVFSQWWMYAAFLIPAIFYLMFFSFKWAILLIPFWSPLVAVLKTLIYIFAPERNLTDSINDLRI